MTEEKQAQAPGVAMDFVYAGRRVSVKNDILHVLYPIKEDGTFADSRMYGKDAFGRHGKTVGGVYTGARFDGATIYGHTAVRWVKQFDDRAQVAGWQALDSEAMTELAARKMEKDQIPVVEEELKGLRRMMYKLRKRGAHAEVHALRSLIDRELYRPPTEKEKEEWADG